MCHYMLYTNTPHNQGIDACRYFLDTRPNKHIPTETLCDLLRMILTMNNFIFNQQHYSRTPLFRTRLIRSPCYFEGRSNSLGFTFMFSVIYYQLFRTRLFRIPLYFELIVLSLHLKSTPLFRTCQKQSTHIRAQLETYCILFELEQNIQRFFNATASADLSDI